MKPLSSLVLLLIVFLAACSGSPARAHVPADSNRKAEARTSSASPDKDAQTLVAAGDIAGCKDLSGAEATARLLDSIPGTVLAVGDLALPDGSEVEFANCYEPTWGRHKARTRPTLGNHDYGTRSAAPYFKYFGAAAGEPTKGYYSYDVGSWHVVAINSNCSKIGGCQQGSPQEKWLRQDLASHPARCALAYWHHPLFSSGKTHGNDPEMKPIWQALYEAGAEIVLNGHDHDYERFAPQDANGVRDPSHGIREFVVGTGGRSTRAFGPALPNSEVRNTGTFGVLKLTLHATRYDWQFIPIAGKTFTDSGSGVCH